MAAQLSPKAPLILKCNRYPIDPPFVSQLAGRPVTGDPPIGLHGNPRALNPTLNAVGMYGELKFAPSKAALGKAVGGVVSKATP